MNKRKAKKLRAKLINSISEDHYEKHKADIFAQLSCQHCSQTDTADDDKKCTDS